MPLVFVYIDTDYYTAAAAEQPPAWPNSLYCPLVGRQSPLVGRQSPFTLFVTFLGFLGKNHFEPVPGGILTWGFRQ